MNLRLFFIFSSLSLSQCYLEGNSNEVITSRLKNVECDILLTVGRLPSTTMPQGWAKSGAKLGIPLKVKFTNKLCAFDMNKESLLGSDFRPFLSLEPLDEPKFVSANGIEKVKVTSGAYSIQAHDLDTQHYACRFFLDFPEGATRNDVTLPAQRIYFMTSCWNQDDHILERATKWKEDILSSIHQIDDQIQSIETAESQKGILKIAEDIRKQTELKSRREKYVAQIVMLEERFPLGPGQILIGPNNIAFLKRGVIARKREGNTMKDQYDWVGTFEFKRFVSS